MGDLKIDLKFASKVHFGLRSNTGVQGDCNILTIGGANQADVYYCINLQVDMGINMGMYNGVMESSMVLLDVDL